ncbi:MAG: phosphatidylcholine/phosphatidylserine synthase [Alphaproteobacteria bacterium]|nr:phosphatidylcholine/phosphatidylserine synthase [Alphaproteobacteria bacterium]
MLRRRPARFNALSVNSLLPNILTVLALCAGMTAIRFGLLGRWEAAALAIVVAGVLDGLDGRIARLLHGTTRFGAELDSLSDFVAFGVAPAVLLYQWSASEFGNIGWIAALAYSTCCALRLARFNTAIDEPNRPVWAGYFFTGLAAPAGAGCAMLPLMLSFQLGLELLRSPFVTAPWLLFVGFLMVSRLPTFSLKRLRIKREHVLPTLVGVAVGAAMLVTYPWLMLSAVGLAYLGSLPFSILSQRRMRKAAPPAAALPLATAQPAAELDRR